MPSWVCNVYLTTPGGEEDRSKIDAVVVTKAGKLFLQIKSSDRGAAKHFSHVADNDARKRCIGVIVIRPYDSVDQIRINARRVLEEIRAKLPPGARAQFDE